MGVEFNCPGHPSLASSSCRIRLWFDNPCDGEAAAPQLVLAREPYRTLVHRTGFDLDSLTLVPRGHERGWPIHIENHWRGYVVEGSVFGSREFDGDEDTDET